MRIVLPLLLVTAAASTARADQCMIVDAKVATKAVDLVHKSTKVISFCEPCRDISPRGPYRIESVTTRAGQVQINGRSVDLAYTFIHTTGDTYQNLAVAAGCQASGVSASIRNGNPAYTQPPAMPGPYVPPSPPPGPPSMARITSVDDLGGTWNVTIRPQVTTCSTAGSAPSTPPPVPAPSVPPVTWTITSTNGDVSLMTHDAHELITTGATLGRFNMLDLQLNETRGTKRALKLHQFSKNLFDGKLVVVEQRSRQTCATAYDVFGRRAP